MYANPLKPWICCHLSLCVLILCEGYHPSGFLFHQGHAENRFSKILKRAVNDCSDDLGADKDDIGTHSNRKGCATFCLLQTFISAVQVYLRAGWSLGNVQDRYIFAGAGGDEVVGRAAAGLPFDTNFGILPPRFSVADQQLLDQIGWHNIFPEWVKYPARFQRVLKLIFPSLVFHEKYLREELPAAHPLWNTLLFTKSVKINGESFFIVERFRSRVLPLTDTEGMVATGVPYEIKLGIQLNTINEKVNTLAAAWPAAMAELQTKLTSANTPVSCSCSCPSNVCPSTASCFSSSTTCATAYSI